jgi:hypothetical protein
MASLFQFLFPNVVLPGTVENAGAEPVPAPEIENADEYDREIEAAFDRAEEKLADGDGGSAASARRE